MEEILGTVISEGMRLGHTWHELAVIFEAIETYQPKWFVEVGIHEGGLTYALLQAFNFDYIGIEINCGIIRPKVKALVDSKKNAQIICGDCFSSAPMGFVETLSQCGNGIIYCDGGDKAKEVFIYSVLLNSGDIIMAHDYTDFERVVKDWEDYKTSGRGEVVPKDVEFLYEFCDKLPEEMFKQTRIIAFMKR